MDETTTVSDVVKEYRERRRLTLRAFADALNEKLINAEVTYASVSRWEWGRNDPDTDFLLNCLVVYEPVDWRTQWAIDCLCAKLPVVFDRDEERKLLILSAAASRARADVSMVARAA